jgi:hypothetical protein
MMNLTVSSSIVEGLKLHALGGVGRLSFRSPSGVQRLFVGDVNYISKDASHTRRCFDKLTYIVLGHPLKRSSEMLS